jgi:hypothetical protein
MIIIFKRIPANTVDHHIEEFIAPALKGGVFRAEGRIENISIWRYEIIQTSTVEYYALVNIEPDAVAERVIKQLHKKPLNGKYIGVQEYHVRHWSNDRRVYNSVMNRGANNKRKADRRRKINKVELKLRRDGTIINEITISTHSGTWAEPHDSKIKK